MPSESSNRSSIRLHTISHDGSAKPATDLENATSEQLTNNVIRSFEWKHINVTVKDRSTKEPLAILSDSCGMVQAGEMLAIMGPSGSGKTTLLNALAYRTAAAGAATTGQILANGQQLSLQTLRQFSAYVEQEDALIGSLTVRETMSFAAGLSLPSSTSSADRKRKVDELIACFGMQDQADFIVGTPIRKGISGGQKKRLGVASRLVTDPKIIFLDEPTSGLDSTLSFEVISYIRKIAKKHKVHAFTLSSVPLVNLIVIASIHQPSTTTFNLFDKVCLMAKGKTCYLGSRPDAVDYFANNGYPIPEGINPAEHYLDLVNTDLGEQEVIDRMHDITLKWTGSALFEKLGADIDNAVLAGKGSGDLSDISTDRPSVWMVPWVLLHPHTTISQ